MKMSELLMEINPYLEDFVMFWAWLLPLIILWTLIRKNAFIALFKSDKKTYEDKMSIYDDVPVEQPQQLPQQTGLSLEDLFTDDGEISDKAFKRMNS
jgi:hypothetical protein